MMPRSSDRNRGNRGNRSQQRPKAPESSQPPMPSPPHVADYSGLNPWPIYYNDLNNLIQQQESVDSWLLRKETMKRIEEATGVPLICYVSRTHHSQNIPTSIDDSDLVGFDDLISTTSGESIDVFIVSNGGSAETSERIVGMLRGRFQNVRFIVPANAFSAATLICFSGDEILMCPQGSLGPIDPQIGGIPARAVLRAFETLEQRLKDEGPHALTAYLPLLERYDLHILEICKSAQDLSAELAGTWLSQYMLKVDRDEPLIAKIVDYFGSYDIQKSHGRSIDCGKAIEIGLKAVNLDANPTLRDLVRSLYNQYEFWFDKVPFYKVYESARDINWGRQIQDVRAAIPAQMLRGESISRLLG